ncbi:MAG: cell division protein FtsI/penicillin-binding protein 2 [Akkermansiaceae bacterium]|jgi:cell division protein FtsI/penicillin-binding protein 2
MDPSFKRRAFFICLALVVGLSALSVRLISLQVWNRKLSDTSAVPRFKIRQIIPARSGNLVDRNNTVIAQNRPEAALIADLNHLNTVAILHRAVAHRYASQVAGWKELNKAEKSVLLKKTYQQIKKNLSKEQIIAEHMEYATEVIGRELRMPYSQITEKLNRGSTQVVLKTRIREDDARKIEDELEKRRIQGFRFERSQRRDYPMPTLAPHLIGFRNHEGEGLYGLEKSMYDILNGRDGERVLKQDENGRVHLTEAAKVTPPKMGKHVRISLDMGIQLIVEEELEIAFQDYSAKKGSIIIVDPHTGDILAMASRPDFNLRDRKDFSKAWPPFAVSAQYEAGSVMKIVAMAAALEKPEINRETVVDCGWGQIFRHGFKIRDHHNYGELTFEEVLVKSSNTGVYQFAERVGRPEFYQYLYDFGFGSRTGFPDREEARGRIQDPTNLRNFASATYGYGVSVTPLQLAMAYSVLANGGTLLKPRLVDSIIANNGTILDHTPVQKVRRVIKETTAREMCLALEQVVLKGTGRSAHFSGYRSGGKTGTSEKWNNKEKRYDPDKKFLTFAGIVPIQAPSFVCVVTIDEPSGLGRDFQVGGGTIAAPVFSKVSARVAQYMNLTPSEEIPAEETSLAHTPSE